MVNSLSIIIPAHNEEENLVAAIKSVKRAASKFFVDYELIILNDASGDRTGEIADELAIEDSKVSRIRVFHFRKNRGFGAMYREGVLLARKKYVMMFPADNEITNKSICNVLKRIGEADIILAYTVNPEVRPFQRRVVSVLFTRLLNFLFGLKIGYFNGLVCYETNLVKEVKMTTNSFAFQAEILVRLLKRGFSYKEVPMMLIPQKKRKSKALSFRNVIGVLILVLKLFFEIRLGLDEITTINIRSRNEKGKVA